MNSKSSRTTSAPTTTWLFTTVTAAKTPLWAVSADWKRRTRSLRRVTSSTWSSNPTLPFNVEDSRPPTPPVTTRQAQLGRKSNEITVCPLPSVRRSFTGVDQREALLFARQIRRPQLRQQGRLRLGHRSAHRQECPLDFPDFRAGRWTRVRIRQHRSLLGFRRFSSVTRQLLRQ